MDRFKARVDVRVCYFWCPHTLIGLEISTSTVSCPQQGSRSWTVDIGSAFPAIGGSSADLSSNWSHSLCSPCWLAPLCSHPSLFPQSPFSTWVWVTSHFDSSHQASTSKQNSSGGHAYLCLSQKVSNPFVFPLTDIKIDIKFIVVLGLEVMVFDDIFLIFHVFIHSFTHVSIIYL